MTDGMTWWPSSAGAKPRYATQRDHSRPTDGEQVALVAFALGTPLLPWQRHVADVASERRPDGSYEYQVVVVSVPRQTGKTTLIHAMGVHRAGFLGRDVFYTAQTGKDARARWNDLIKRLGDPATHARIKARHTDTALRGGSEHATFTNPRTGRQAVFQAFAPTEKALHGYTPPTVVVDEAFAQSAASGELLMGAIDPAQFTLVDKQIWLVSTRGTAESTFFHDWVRRAGSNTPRVALFDWGATDDQDPFNADDVAAFHPGVGFQLGDKLITPADVLGALESEKVSRAEYERAYGNRETLTTSNMIEPETWRALVGNIAPPADTSTITLSYDVSFDRLSSTIMANWITRDGRPAAKIVKAGPGVTWLASSVHDLVKQWRTGPPVAVGNGDVINVTTQLRNRGREVRELTEKEYAAACGAFLTLIDDERLVHDDSPVFEQSVTGLVPRPGAVDGLAFSRRHSVGDSSPGIAAAAGLWIADAHKPHGKPMFRFTAA